MSEEIRKWFNDFVNSIVEKIKTGKELNALETQIISNYASNLVLYDYVDKRLGELERNLRDEIRKTREELLANDEKIKQELLANDERIKQELLANDERIKQELLQKIEEVKKELLANDEKVKQELLQKIEGVKKELLANDERIKQELKAEIQSVKTDLENKIKEVDRKVEATRSDLGLLAEEVYVKNFVDYLESNGEKVVSVYRHYETSLGEIDAVVETSGKVYAVEVKMRAEVSDVDDLLNKTKVLKEELGGKEVYPVLTGSKISKTVRGYAKGLGVLII
jgi:DNA repair exonuclease SbcCD ATPase subunit